MTCWSESRAELNNFLLVPKVITLFEFNHLVFSPFWHPAHQRNVRHPNIILDMQFRYNFGLNDNNNDTLSLRHHPSKRLWHLWWVFSLVFCKYFYMPHDWSSIGAFLRRFQFQRNQSQYFKRLEYLHRWGTHQIFWLIGLLIARFTIDALNFNHTININLMRFPSSVFTRFSRCKVIMID